MMSHEIVQRLRPETQKALGALGFVQLTPIQAAAIPVALAGGDVVAQAKTGSGKTLAFALPILNELDASQRKPLGLILCPTRELAEQVAEQIRSVAQYISNVKVLTLCGGTPMPPQIASLGHGANIVVGTPGRVMDHLKKRRLDLSQITHFVLDEADRMLDMGFADELNAVFQRLPDAAHTLLFSATFPESVEQVVNDVTRSPSRVQGAEETVALNITQQVYKVEAHTRENALKGLITDIQPERCIVFCTTKKATQQIAQSLASDGFSVVALHGDLEQRDRNDMLAMFSANCARILVATDVAARGLDIDDVPLVINYQVSEDADTHIHRIGRTGRAGNKGMAITLMAPDEEIFVARIEEIMNQTLPKKGAQNLRFHRNRIVLPSFSMLVLSGGKRDKLRPGDILGSLTQDAGLPNDDIGKIKITATQSHVAIKFRSVKRALQFFRDGKVKGKRLRAKKVSTISA